MVTGPSGPSLAHQHFPYNMYILPGPEAGSRGDKPDSPVRLSECHEIDCSGLFFLLRRAQSPRRSCIAVFRIFSHGDKSTSKCTRARANRMVAERDYQWRAAARMSEEADDWLQPQQPSQRMLIGQNTLVSSLDPAGSLRLRLYLPRPE